MLDNIILEKEQVTLINNVLLLTKKEKNYMLYR